jgi:hypothetical protein
MSIFRMFIFRTSVLPMVTTGEYLCHFAAPFLLMLMCVDKQRVFDIQKRGRDFFIKRSSQRLGPRPGPRPGQDQDQAKDKGKRKTGD